MKLQGYFEQNYSSEQRAAYREYLELNQEGIAQKFLT